MSNGDSSLEEALDAERKPQQASEDWRGDIKPCRRVFVSRAVGMRYGKAMELIVGGSQTVTRLKALFVAFSGVCNLVPCPEFIRRAGACGMEQAPVPQRRGGQAKREDEKEFPPES